MNFKKELLWTSIILVVAFLFFELSPIDTLLQDHLYDFKEGFWIVSRENNVLSFFFYSGFKKALIFFALSLIVLLIFSFTPLARERERERERESLLLRKRKSLLLVLLSILFVPLVVSTIKAITDVPCPRDLIHYGGDHPFANVVIPYPKGFKHKERIRCYPAGHASGGFALMSLFFLFSSKRNQIRGLIFGLVAGWSTGIYKMSIGDHFLGHTMITMILSWWLILIISRLIFKSKFKSKL